MDRDAGRQHLGLAPEALVERVVLVDEVMADQAGAERADPLDLGQRAMHPGEPVDALALGGAQQVGGALPAGEADPDRQHADAGPEDRLAPRQVGHPRRGDGAEHHVAPPLDLGQQHAPEGLEHRAGGDAESPGPGGEPGREIGPETDLQGAGIPRVPALAGAAAGEVEGRVVALQVAAPIGQGLGRAPRIRGLTKRPNGIAGGRRGAPRPPPAPGRPGRDRPAAARCTSRPSGGGGTRARPASRPRRSGSGRAGAACRAGCRRGAVSAPRHIPRRRGGRPPARRRGHRSPRVRGGAA